MEVLVIPKLITVLLHMVGMIRLTHSMVVLEPGSMLAKAQTSTEWTVLGGGSSNVCSCLSPCLAVSGIKFVEYRMKMPLISLQKHPRLGLIAIMNRLYKE